MPLCSDPTLTYLKGLGYNVVRLPRRNLEPLDLLGRTKGPFKRLGKLSQIWETDAPVPTADRSKTGDVESRRSAEIRSSLGIRVLDDLLQGLAGSPVNAGLDSALKNARSLQFVFGAPDIVSVDPFAIGEYLKSGDLDLENAFARRYLEDEDARVYVVNEVLQSASFTMEITAKNSAKAAVDIEGLNKALKGKIAVKQSGSQGRTIKFSAGDPVTFGFQAYEVEWRDGDWEVIEMLPAGDGYLSADVKTKPVLLEEGRRVLIEDEEPSD